MMTEKQVVIYCRVDQGGNAEIRQHTLAQQYNRLKHYAAQEGMQIVARYEDNGYAGNTLKRPGLTKMLVDFRTGHFDTVLVVDRGRLYRGALCCEPHWPFRVISLNSLERDIIR